MGRVGPAHVDRGRRARALDQDGVGAAAQVEAQGLDLGVVDPATAGPAARHVEAPDAIRAQEGRLRAGLRRLRGVNLGLRFSRVNFQSPWDFGAGLMATPHR